MCEFKISVARVDGVCEADPPMAPGQYFTVSNGNVRIPEGSHVCAWALHSLLPIITPQEQDGGESKENEWKWRSRQVQCPDPDGGVVFEIERMGSAESESGPTVQVAAPEPLPSMEADLWTLRVVVAEVKGKCTSGMKPGDYFTLRSGRLYIPADRHFCLYALQATFPFLAAKQRPLPEGDWLNRANWITCPDPGGTVIMRVDRVGTSSDSAVTP